jgi:asparaginyl-tRNA synthetase
MSQLCHIPDLTHRRDIVVAIQGWVDRIQQFRRHAFIILRDGPGAHHRVQVVIPGTLGSPPVPESYVRVTGTVKALPEGKYSYQPVEVQAASVEVLSGSDPEVLSRCPSDAGPETKITERHLYLRDARFALITQARGLFLQALRKHFRTTGCTEIVPPCFVGNQCEGGATLFKLKYPARDTGDMEVYLTQSSQFYLEYAVPGMGDCYCIYPSFRAEKSHTRRHLTEFLHAEAEWSGIATLEGLLDKLRGLLQGTLTSFLKYCDQAGDLLGQLQVRERVVKLLAMTRSIQVMTHAEAIAYCRAHEIYADPATKTPFGERDDIPEAQERQMIDQIGTIVFLVKFPREFKSFYMASDPADRSYVLGCDVEVPGVGEIIGSGVRVATPEELSFRLKEQGLKEAEYREYLDLRKYGAGQTAGMGLGVDRLLTWLLDLHSIREVVTFPRYPGQVVP